jgi:hypothetical protein
MHALRLIRRRRYRRAPTRGAGNCLLHRSLVSVLQNYMCSDMLTVLCCGCGGGGGGGGGGGAPVEEGADGVEEEERCP